MFVISQPSFKLGGRIAQWDTSQDKAFKTAEVLKGFQQNRRQVPGCHNSGIARRAGAQSSAQASRAYSSYQQWYWCNRFRLRHSLHFSWRLQKLGWLLVSHSFTIATNQTGSTKLEIPLHSFILSFLCSFRLWLASGGHIPVLAEVVKCLARISHLTWLHSHCS